MFPLFCLGQDGEKGSTSYRRDRQRGRICRYGKKFVNPRHRCHSMAACASRNAAARRTQLWGFYDGAARWPHPAGAANRTGNR
jgi:hypothetical protein